MKIEVKEEIQFTGTRLCRHHPNSSLRQRLCLGIHMSSFYGRIDESGFLRSPLNNALSHQRCDDLQAQFDRSLGTLLI